MAMTQVIPPRNTSIVVVVLESNEVYIIVSLSMRKDTQVISIDPTMGSLRYRGKLGHECFISEEEALRHVTDGSRIKCRSVIYGCAVLGYAALGSLGLLLVAKKLEATIPSLPGGGCVYTVAQSEWIKVPLQYAQPQGKGELKNILELTDVDIDGKHYFSETRDITRPFPSKEHVDNPDREFVWNEFLSQPFKDIGLPGICVILLQGFAECRSLGLGGSLEQMVALTARRSRLHPGTRYLARGLNACFSTGNEVECEQLVWTLSRGSQITPFCSYIWRRGTIPIWWGAELKLTAAEAELYVSSHDPYGGSAKYYQRLSKRYAKQESDSVEVNNRKETRVPIVCVNLLRNEEGKSETLLVEHFSESLNYINSSVQLSDAQLRLINFDWHANVRLNGEQQTIGTFWKLLKSPTMAIGFCEGTYYKSLQDLGTISGSVLLNKDIEGGFRLRSFQKGIIRFNCADSLDRTNAASYFGCLQVFAEQCKRLGISLDKNVNFDFSMSRQKQLSNAQFIGYLPPGWEERSDAVTGKIFYIDHNTRTTTWEHPCPDRPWKRFDMSFEQFKNSTNLYPITQLAELFQLSGDIHATLYTGSKATHSQILNIFNDESGKFKQFAAAQHVKITLQRRYKNVIVDSYRQKQWEMFLGIRMARHLPSVYIHSLEVLSRPPAFFLKPLDRIFPRLMGHEDLLNYKRKNMTWGACLPRCSNGTNIILPLTGPMNPGDLAVMGGSTHLDPQGNEYLPFLYNFEESEGDLNFHTRIVSVTFYPASIEKFPITLGQIEVLGVPLPWREIFHREGMRWLFIERSDMEDSKSRDEEIRGFKVEDYLSSGEIFPVRKTGQLVKSSFPRNSLPEILLPKIEIGIQHYLDCVRRISDKGHDLNFIEAMTLEIERLQVNLSAAERDRALLSVGIIPSTVDPNRSIDMSYLIKLSKLADTLAFVGHTFFEDHIIGATGLEAVETCLDFWNLHEVGSMCMGKHCEVKVFSTSATSSESQATFFSCTACGKKACKVCCAGKGAILLSRFSSKDAKNFSGKQTQFSFTGSDGAAICRLCCPEEVYHSLYVDYVRVLASLRRQSRACKAASKALTLVVGSKTEKRQRESEKAETWLRKLLNGEESLAEFPYAGLLHLIQTAKGSESALSLLLPIGYGEWSSYWRAEPSCQTVDFPIALGSLSDVSGVILLVSSHGYSSADCPHVTIWASNNINREDRSCMGQWDVQTSVATPDIYGPETEATSIPRHVKFHFQNPVRCRIVWIQLSLPRSGFLSLDKACIHAKRIIVFGSMAVPAPLTDSLSDNSNSNTHPPAKLWRFRVPVEGERLSANDLVLEQHLPIGSPPLAGFRFDYFSAIKPRVTHSPAFKDLGMWSSSPVLLEDRFINPPILYIRVSVVQDYSPNWVVVKEYRLPEARAGTIMYFDFPAAIHAKAVAFRLAGDVAAFCDDPAEEGPNFRHVASGLSLVNRVKLFYYPDPNEVGRLASFSAV
ncbi:putative phosphoinositide phosphatase SAC9 isoform X2 [Wolffia australiana]